MMKTKLRVAAALVLIVCLLAVVMPAAAGAIKTPVGGVFTLTGAFFPPEYREWWSGPANRHYRNIITYWDQEAEGDQRLAGYPLTVVNANEKYVLNEDTGMNELASAVLWGTSTVYSDADRTNPTWECTYVGKFDQTGKYVELVCKGVGIYEGLHAKTSGYCPSLTISIYDYWGEILEPGGK